MDGPMLSRFIGDLFLGNCADIVDEPGYKIQFYYVLADPTKVVLQLKIFFTYGVFKNR